MKDGKYIIIPDEYKSIGTYWIHLHVNGNNVTYFDSLRVKYFQKKSIDNKTIKTNIYKIQVYDSIMCWLFCVGFIDVILNNKGTADFTILFSLNNFREMMILYHNTIPQLKS